MGRPSKFGKRKNHKCPIEGCGRTFSAPRYLNEHLKGVHNNNNKKKHNNKNLLKKFIRFIINVIFYINENFDIKNYVGDKDDQKHAMHMFENNNPDIKLANKKLKIEGYSNTGMFIEEERENTINNIKNIYDGDSDSEFGENLDIKIKKIRNKMNEEEEEKKRKEAEELKEYNDIMNFLKQFDKKVEKKKEEDKIPIKRNIIEVIKEKRKNEIKKSIEMKIIEKTDTIIDSGDIIKKLNDPIIAYEADHLYPKISARDLFRHMDINEKDKKFIINYINKNYIDYPTDEEIKEMLPAVYSHYTKTLSGNGEFSKKYNEVKSKVLEFFENGGKSFTCEFCNKFVSNKRRHCMHCKQFLEKIDNDPKNKILKKYIEDNYKKIKLEEVEIIIENFKKKYEKTKKNSKIGIKKSEFFKKNLPHFIKYEQKLRKRLIKINREKKEVAEMSLREVSQIPPIQKEPGLAKKFFMEVTSFDRKKKIKIFK